MSSETESAHIVVGITVKVTTVLFLVSCCRAISQKLNNLLLTANEK